MAKKKSKPPKVATRTDPVIEWPEGADSLTLVQLHYPNDPDRQRWLFGLIEAAFLAGRLAAVSWQEVRLPKAQALQLGLANHEALIGRDAESDAIHRHLPVIARDAYRDWPDRPPLPPDSPLRDWLSENGKPSTDAASDQALGAATRQRMARLARHNQERHEAREAEWQRWRECGARIQAMRNRPASKLKLAELIKAELNLPDAIATIRRKL